MAGMSAVARTGWAVLVVGLVAGCPSGGDDAPPNTSGGQNFVVSPENLSFAAANTSVGASPPTRSVMATVSGPTNNGTLFARVVVGDPTVVTVENIQILGPTQARFTVRPAAPSSLTPGNHATVITVIVCNTNPGCSGPQLPISPATVNVAYQIGPLPTAPPQSLAPSVGAAGVAGDVVLRGSGFTNVTSVSFGGTPASALFVMSDDEIRATYPALAAGTLSVSLSASGAAVPFSQSLTLVPAGTFASTTLLYPSLGTPLNVRGFAFDAVNQALIVGLGAPTPTNNAVVRYTFNGVGWLQQAPVTVATLRDFTLSLDRTRLLALTDTTVEERDPSTLALIVPATTRTTNGATTADSFLKGIVATNDGQAFIVSSSASFGQDWLYNVAARTFSVPLFDTFTFPEIGGPDNGTRAVLVQSGSLVPVQQYNAFTGTVTPTSLTVSHFHPVAPARVENINLPASDRNGNRMLLPTFNGGAIHALYDANFAELGRVPSSDIVSGTTANTAAYAISPDAARAYILQIGTGICRVRAFDLRTSPGPGAPYQEVTVTGFPINLVPNCPASQFDTPIRMLVNPTGDTLFIAGNTSIRVVRLP